MLTHGPPLGVARMIFPQRLPAFLSTHSATTSSGQLLAGSVTRHCPNSIISVTSTK
jgi:hypothetical protein